MEEERKIEELQRLIDTHENIVFFGGAGVSTESGIPDFRSVDGLYHQKYDVPPETILSHSYFLRYPEKFYAFTATKCFRSARNRTRRIRNLQSSKRREN